MYGPEGLDLGANPNTPEFLLALRNYAWVTVPKELIHDRWDVWQFLGEYGPQGVADPEDWWTLFPERDKSLEEFRGLLTIDLECDNESVCYWVRLCRRNAWGYIECLRILHHMLKDKGRARAPDDPRESQAEKNSRYLKTASQEALEALDNPSYWEQGPSYTAQWPSKGPDGKGKGNGYDTSSSSSSSGWPTQGLR